MNLISIWILLFAPLLHQEGDSVVQVRTASYYKGPARASGVIRDAGYGDIVKVAGVEGRWTKVVLKDGSSAYILSDALIPREGFVPAPANEEELARLKAQNFDAGRLNPETEKEYRKEKGGEVEKGYQQLDALQKRSPSRAEAERRLLDFRRSGKLGELSTVK